MCKYNIEKLLCRCPYYFSFFQFFSMFKETFITSQLFFLSLRGFSTLIRKAEKIWLKYICKGTLFLFTFFLVLGDAISRWNNIYSNFDRKGQWEMSRWKSTTDNADRTFHPDDLGKFEKPFEPVFFLSRCITKLFFETKWKCEKKNSGARCVSGRFSKDFQLVSCWQRPTTTPCRRFFNFLS